MISEMLIDFLETKTYAESLGKIRKLLKPYIRDLQIRRQRNGVLLRGSPEKVCAALLMMPGCYSVRRQERKP